MRCGACRGTRGVIVTSDKCYYNEEWVWGYREDSRLGGHDPYSGSKGAAELVVHAYQQSFFNPAQPGGRRDRQRRAGNVIGGGDWAHDRLVPDIMRSLLKGEPTRDPQPPGDPSVAARARAAARLPDAC